MIDNETFDVYQKGKTGKLLKIPKLEKKHGIGVELGIYHDEKSGRVRRRTTYLSYIVGRYVFGLKRKYIFEYKDGNIYNFSKDNIVVRYLLDLCPNWKHIENTDAYISSSGLFYSGKMACLIQPHSSGYTGYKFFSYRSLIMKRSHLVWKYFGDCEIPEGYVIDHIDNNPSNDDISNLQCITLRENTVKDMRRREYPVGVYKNGKRHYYAKISYTLNGVRYIQVPLGSFDSVAEASDAYQYALSMVNEGKNPITHFGGHYKVKAYDKKVGEYFVSKENYKKNTYNDAYTFNIPYIDGKRHYLASFMSKDIVNEIDGIMNSHKYTDTFIEWFEWFKENELPKYIERDKAARSLNYNKKVGNKGYGWFSPKNCWRCKRRVNNKEYLLGYFHNEECCKYMNDEFDKALAAGNVEEWYSNIELHKAYARALFKDESINVNHVASKLSAVGFLGTKVTDKKNKDGVDEKYLVKHESTVDNRNEFNVVQSKSVVQMLNGEVVNTFYSINEAAKFMGGENKSTYISLCCRGVKSNYKGFEWKFI